MEDELVAFAATIPADGARAACIHDRVPLQVGPPAEFLQQFVSRSQPVVLTGCVAHWAALQTWTHARLRAALGDSLVHVALTPDGLADSVSESSRQPDG